MPAVWGTQPICHRVTVRLGVTSCMNVNNINHSNNSPHILTSNSKICQKHTYMYNSLSYKLQNWYLTAYILVINIQKCSHKIHYSLHRTMISIILFFIVHVLFYNTQSYLRPSLSSHVHCPLAHTTCENSSQWVLTQPLASVHVSDQTRP